MNEARKEMAPILTSEIAPLSLSGRSIAVVAVVAAAAARLFVT